MVQKQVRWTSTALSDKFGILEYWLNRNKSTIYSNKLDQLFDKAIEQLLKFPHLGKKTDYKNIRVIILRNYLIFYLIENDFITVIRIWDTSRDPEKFKI